MITLVLGGARSGKSAVGEVLVAKCGRSVTYVATADPANDQEFLARVAQHRQRRPSDWVTIECGVELATTVAGLEGAVLIDSLGTWLARWPDFVVNVATLLEAFDRVRGDVVIVSDEVGLGVHPTSEVGRAYRDALGSLNQSVADYADVVLLVVAGQVLTLKGGHDS
ncbi:MAG: bifunctional adenosylcobinamide kinase/adenosylcobinamide-phosphate guanylyltransferase [Acidobacteriota bacterium]|nr:bifunctional adenosylcobinamide kinase/adenosylcobinamide-phosphate guanylyltransferase [Acidobacteriota bacterium]